jgi:hypothetical protein
LTKTQYRAGTVIKDPPTPGIPEARPARSPAMISTAKGRIKSIMRISVR